MRLLRLEASGFKSFCDKIAISFVQRGISIVVGPNGCGKSNIVDAIRWTLGEQSAKHLRGTSMEDVIFNGSAGRQPVSMAQVTLVFSNPEHDTIPRYSEFSEIAVTRRLYRSGESQYLINKTNCRLADIRELFMDTGIGGKGYSIIEQGKIDQIITSRAQERRQIIDEAAGIVKFKTKRKEAERKFEATKQNLLRVEDILAELVAQEETLSVQVERADEYLEARARLERLQNCIAATRWYQLKDQADKIVEKRDQAMEDRNNLKLIVSNLEAREATLGIEIARSSSELEELNQSHTRIKEAIIKLESRQGSAKLTLENLDEWERKNREEIDLIDKQIQTLELQLQTYQEDNQKLSGDITTKTAMLEQLQEKEESSGTDLSNQKLRLSNLQQKEMEAITAVTAGQNQLVQLKERLDDTSAKQEQLEQQNKDLLTEQQKAQSNWEKLTATISEKQEKRDSIKESIENITDQYEEKEERVRVLERKVKELSQTINQSENRLQSLEELVLSHEEYDAATKGLLDFMDSHPEIAQQLGFLGTIAEAVSLPQEIKPQTMAFLNRYLNLLVFRSVKSLEGIVKLIHEKGFEQIQFCFLDVLSSENGAAATSLASILPGKPGFEKLPFIDGFETLDLPIYSLSDEQLQKSDGLIDSEASIMTKARVFLVGQPGKSNLAETFLKRRSEIKTLEDELERSTQQLESVESMLEDEKETLEELKRMLKSSKEKLVAFDLELAGLEKEHDGKESEKQRLDNAASIILKEWEQIEQTRKDFEEKIKKLTRSIEDNNERQTTIQKVCRDLQTQIERTEADREEATSELQSLKVVLASLTEKQQNTQESLRRMNSDIEERKTQKSSILNRKNETEDKRKETQASLQEVEEQLPKLLEEVTQKETAQKELKNTIETRTIEHMDLKETFKKESHKINELKEKNHKFEIKLAQLAQEAKNIEDTLFNESSLKPEDLIQTFDVTTFKIAEESQNIIDLKQKIGGMDNINLAAKGEYEKLKERLDFLQTQSSDLTKSIEALENSINTINQESRKRFRTTFKQVNEKFTMLFPELFGGGEAYLRLTDDEDILESGVEIIAQPPGKKLQNMTLLSGGEKALTAIALIFAVFMIKPSPFCLLDEVDAPLDDANNVRFNKHVQAMTDNSQFIIITHNKKTMEIGDALFGVTMEEPGISKVVSVDFSSLSPDSLQSVV